MFFKMCFVKHFAFHESKILSLKVKHACRLYCANHGHMGPRDALSGGHALM